LNRQTIELYGADEVQKLAASTQFLSVAQHRSQGAQ
jgi:hypothetical protein